MRIVGIGNAKFIENSEISGSEVPREVDIKEFRVQVLLACAFSCKVIAPFSGCYKINEKEQHNNEPMMHNEPIMEEP